MYSEELKECSGPMIYDIRYAIASSKAQDGKRNNPCSEHEDRPARP